MVVWHDLDSRIAQRLSVGIEQYFSISASADGQRLVASIANPSGGLWTVPLSASETTATEDDAKPSSISTPRTTGPRSGADYILYMASKGGAHGLWKSQRDGSATELWSAMNGGLTGPASISPDGQTIRFSYRKQNRGGLYLMTSNGTNVRQLNVPDSLDVRGMASWSLTVTGWLLWETRKIGGGCLKSR